MWPTINLIEIGKVCETLTSTIPIAHQWQHPQHCYSAGPLCSQSLSQGMGLLYLAQEPEWQIHPPPQHCTTPVHTALQLKVNEGEEGEASGNMYAHMYYCGMHAEVITINCVYTPCQGAPRSCPVLRVRAEKVCEEGKWWQDIQNFRQVFRANGYPEPVVKNNLRDRLTPSNTTMESETPSSSFNFHTSKECPNELRRCADYWQWKQWWRLRTLSEAD